jgi:hypothetical protein
VRTLVSLVLLATLILSMPADASGAGLKATLTQAKPQSMKTFKGLEIYMWYVDGQPRWSLLIGTNRNKTDAEIRDPSETITSITELTTLLEKVAPGEYVSLTNEDPNKSKSVPAEEIAMIGNVCKKLGLHFNGDTPESLRVAAIYATPYYNLYFVKENGKSTFRLLPKMSWIPNEATVDTAPKIASLTVLDATFTKQAITGTVILHDKTKCSIWSRPQGKDLSDLLQMCAKHKIKVYDGGNRKFF